MSDGSKQLEIFNEDIRYKKNGKMLEYDSSFVENTDDIIVKKKSFAKADEYAYVNTAGDCKQYIPEELDADTPVVLTKGGNMISFAPVYDIADEKVDAEVAEMQSKKVTDKENAKTEQKIAPDVKLTETDSARYKKENIVYEFVSENNGIKENVIFESKPKKYDVSYEFEMPNLYLEYSKDTNQIYVKSNTNNKIVAYISSPFLNDNTGINLNYDITTNVEQRDEKWIVTYELPKEYFENKKIEYPVVLDPSVWWDSENNIDIRETLNIGGSKSSVIESSSRFMLANLYAGTGTGTDGYGAQVNVRFKNLHNILKGKYISFSYFNMVKESKSGTPKFSIYPIMEDWNYYTTNWNNKPDVSDESICDMNITYDSDTIQPWITNWVRKLSSGEINNDYGIAFYPQENSEYFYLWFYGLSATNTSSGTIRKPVLIVDYKDVEDINATYDGTFQIEGSYDEENKKIDFSWESYNDDIDRYDLYIRKNDNNHFEYAGCTTETNILYDAGSEIETYDFRVVAVNEGQTAQYGECDAQYLSNICSFKKEVDQSDESSNKAEVYNLNVKDIDGDGLEDGYEIWDFKTLWNAETDIDEEGNKTYDLDTDDDGFPDSYEVFTLGTDPAVANPEMNDSDNDGLSDLEEYAKGTDPWLVDSDFDNVKDSDDGTPRKTNNYTRQTIASEAQVHKGLYDKKYSTVENGVTTTYIENIYRGNIKSVDYDYGDSNENKALKYFYDEYGNNTAIIEEYDDEYYEINGLKNSQTICITYSYDELGNVVFICDQSNKYTMEYGEDYDIDKVSIGSQALISYREETLEDNSENENELSSGEIISKIQNIATYGNGQIVKVITVNKKVSDDDTTSSAKEILYYYDDDISESYKTEYNSSGQIIKLYDYTGEEEILYEYAYTDEGTKVQRKDEFIKESTTTEDEENHTSIKNTTYTFNDVTNNKTRYTSTVVNDIDADDSNDELSASATLFNQDSVTYEFSEKNKSTVTSLYSALYNKNILNVISTVNSNLKTTYEIDIYNEDKKIEYAYDLAGNITEIKVNGDKLYEYKYDAHGRLIVEKDYAHLSSIEYGYDETSNVQAVKIGSINENGTIVKINKTKYATYDNNQWADQMTSFNGNTISYDGVGNPLTYINGEKFTWSKGRQLSEIDLEDNSKIEFSYNESGLRSYKNTQDVSTEYVWDDGKLIREQVTYKSTHKKYDVWYFYDSQDNVVGFEYSFIGDTGSKQKVRIYYEKNLQGDVIGLLDSRGAEIATYSYDAWGNVTDTVCYEGNEIPYNLNHIKYRGYYMDEETDFYYLETRYYDPEICRFINSDDVNNLGSSGMIFGYNLYAYCEGNPVRYTDATGKSLKSIWKKIKKYVNTALHLGNTVARSAGIDTTSYGAFLLQMKKDKNGIYHASFNGWQQYFGYNDFYDFMFDIGTSMDKAKFQFTCNKTKYILWAWKGDYINLGAGAELGIYYGGGPHWKVNKKLAMSMVMTVSYKNKTIISYSKKTWWITGFNPKYQNAKAKNLKVTYKVYFNSYAMYSSFNKTYGKNKGWSYDGRNYMGKYSF
ncbi:MAG: RHS repeat-associated core domain-containing protein [Eubacterium sp.]